MHLTETNPPPISQGMSASPRQACARPDVDATTDTTIVLLVAQQVRLGHVTESDRDDLTQYLRTELLCRAHRFRPAQGAWATFARHVLEGELKRWIRHHLRDRRDHRLSRSMHGDDGCTLSPSVAALTDQRAAQRDAASLLREDVACVLGELRPADRAVAEALMTMCPSRAARHLRRPRSDIYRVMGRLRDLLVAAGIGG
jgi:hypothetical protein